MEYYDREARCYRGVIPELLSRFSAQSQYDVRYYASDKGDQRMELAAGQQVDIISCPEDLGAVPHRTGEDILLLEDTGNGQAAVLCLLDTAPGGLSGDLRAFLSGISQQELTGLAIQAARDDPPPDRLRLHTAFGGLALTAALLGAVLVWVVLSHRRKMKRLLRDRETDPVTGLGNHAWLVRHSQTTLNDRNRVLYTMFCFSFTPSSLADAGTTAVSFRHMASVLQDCISDTDLLARISDTCFAILRLSTGKNSAMEWMTGILARLREEFRQTGGEPLGVAAGAYPLKAEDRNLEVAISRALHSAQSARKTESGCQLFEDKILRAAQDEQRLRADARHALQNREFQIYIQFYVDFFTGQAVGGEVIPLWEHPEKGILAAEQFLPLLEQEGLSPQLDEFVLERSCAMLDTLRQNGKEKFFLLYRLSEGTLRSETLKERWEEIAGEYHFNRKLLLFGVPQRLLERGSQSILRNMAAIQEMNLRLVLDGFNGQLTALLQARNAQFCGVKLNGSFINQEQYKIVLRAAVRAGHELELAILAEGADTVELASGLRELECDMLRGELYAHPLPAWEAMKKLMPRS